MKKYDVVIIGGGPAGLSAGEALVKKHKDKTIALIREEETNFIPCGMPYIFGQLDYDPDKNVKPYTEFTENGGVFIVDKVSTIDRKHKSLITKKGETYLYDKLIIATGSTPIVPKFIKGWDNPNIYYITKSYSYIKSVLSKLKDAKDIAIVGGGFIGLETADELASNPEKNITVIEMENHVLSLAFSDVLCQKAEKALEARGVSILTGTKVTAIEQEDKTKIVFDDGTSISVDAVIFALGYKANNQLAVDADIPVNKFGAIVVDTFMRTMDPDIVAIGDCAQKRDFVTRKPTNAMLASVAGAESRFVSESLFTIESIRNSIGTIKIFSTVLNDETFAVAGITEKEAKNENIDVLIGETTQMDKHPGSLPNQCKVNVRLTIMKKTNYIIGAEIHGGNSVGEMINVIGTAIQAKLNIWDFYTFQTGSQPMLTAGPTVSPLMKAIENVIHGQVNAA